MPSAVPSPLRRALLVTLALTAAALCLTPLARAAAPALTGTELTAPPGAVASSNDLFPNAVACGADGSCAAVGTYTPAVSGAAVLSGVRANLEAGGTWQAGTQLALPGDATTATPHSPSGRLNAVACPADGRCLAVGSYSRTESRCLGGQDVATALAESLSTRTWSASEDAGPGDPCNRVQATQVACASTAWCTAIGFMYDNAGKTYMWMGTGDVDGLDTSATVPTPSSTTGEDGSEADVACASAVSLCIATGIDAGGGQSNLGPNFVLVGTGGSWGHARAVPVPQTGDTDATLESVACSPTRCYGSGYFTDADGEQRGLIVSTDGSAAWSTTSPVAGDLAGISCGAAGCTAAGIPDCSQAGTLCAYTSYTDQSGAWSAVRGAGVHALYRCPRTGSCFGFDEAGAVYELSGGASAQLGQEQMPADCASESGEACGSAQYPVWTCAITTCASVQPFTTTSGTGSSAAFTFRSGGPVIGAAAQPRITLVCTPDPVGAGGLVTCTATVANPVAGATATPTGTVKIGTGAAGDPSCTLAAASAGTASCSVSFAAPTPGTATLTAAYGGDGAFAPGTATTTETVAAAGTAPPLASGGGGGGGGGTAPSGGASKPRTPQPSVSGVSAHGSTTTLTVSCPSGGATCRLAMTMTYTAPARSGRAAAKRKTSKVVIASAHVTIGAGRHSTIHLTLNAAGRRLLTAKHRLHVTISITSQAKPLTTKTVTLTTPHHH